jgi:hypothetical protein
MDLLIEQRREEIALPCQRYDVRRLEVFGFAARGADFDPATSDADFLVDFQPESLSGPLEQFFGLAGALQRLLGRPIDLLESGAVRNTFIQTNIDQAREGVYAA